MFVVKQREGTTTYRHDNSSNINGQHKIDNNRFLAGTFSSKMNHFTMKRLTVGILKENNNILRCLSHGMKQYLKDVLTITGKH